jgi:hypothetical protein
LKKLIIFGEERWEGLREVVEEGKGEWGGDVEEPASFSILDEVEEEVEELPETSLDIQYRRRPWWKKQHWNDILDEQRRWGELSRENQKKLNKLLGGR